MELLKQIWEWVYSGLTHEYAMAVYGAMLYHLEVWRSEKNKADKLDKNFNHRRFFSKEWDDVIRSVAWVGFAIAFDDELLDKYNSWAEEDFQNLESWMYFVGGFSIDRLVSMFKKEGKNVE